MTGAGVATAGISAATVRAGHERYLFPCATPYYDEPIVPVEARGVRLIDAEGREYLDFFAGILTTSIGHCHPAVVERVREQVGRLGHTSTLYVTETAVAAARRLADIAPDGLTRTFFTNSGTEANETAIMLACLSTGRSEIVALRHAYSGRSILATNLTAHAPWRPLSSTVPGITHALAPNEYRCPFKTPCDDGCIDAWVHDLEEVIQTTTTGRPAALILEPIQGVGGFVPLPPEYMRRAAEIIHGYGGLLISDEVQTGFGRTGERWFGIQHAGIAPDIMVMAKGIANGLPVGATMATDEIAAAWTSKTISTYGGNPVCMAATGATLEVMVQEDTPARSAERGAQLHAGLESIQAEYAWIGDVRGRGLMQAIELVEDPESKIPDPGRAGALLEETKQEGLLLGTSGLYGNVMRFGPSMLVTAAEVDDALARLARACHRVGAST